MRSIALALTLVAAVIVGDASAAPPVVTADDFVVYKAAHGKPWGPSQGPAVEAARRIFAAIEFTGKLARDVRTTLGEPDAVTTTNGHAIWRYVRHDGEQGDIRELEFAAGRVVAVKRTLTQ